MSYFTPPWTALGFIVDTGEQACGMFSEVKEPGCQLSSTDEISLVNKGAVGLGEVYPSVPGLPETLRLDVWKKRVKSAIVTSKQVISPLILPDGSRPQYLQIVETVTLL